MADAMLPGVMRDDNETVSRTIAPGARFGRWTVLRRSDRASEFVCRCDCGTERIVLVYSLSKGKSRSCGCLHRELMVGKPSPTRTHGMKGSPEYRCWRAMKTRCLNPNHAAHGRYAGRGITICHRWLNSFEAFLEDMGPRPSLEHTIERKDNNKGYEPNNCVWATRKEQAQNRRRPQEKRKYRGTVHLRSFASELGTIAVALSEATGGEWRHSTQPGLDGAKMFGVLTPPDGRAFKITRRSGWFHALLALAKKAAA